MSHPTRSSLVIVLVLAAACNVYTDDLLRGGTAEDGLQGSAGSATLSSGAAGLPADNELRGGSGGASLGSGGEEPQPAAAGNASTHAGGGTNTNDGGDAGSSASGNGGNGGSGGAAGGGGVGGSAGTSGGGGGHGGGASVACGGAVEFGLCWYLGAVGESCTTVCAERGGVDLNGVTAVGTASQGGSLAECATLLTALGITKAPTVAFRVDGRGLGCHLYSQSPYWLTSPLAEPADQSSFANLVCSCRE